MQCASPLKGGGRYTLIGKGCEVGGGTYGVVLAAWDKKVEELVVLKKQKARSKEAGNELHALRILPPHANVLELMDVFVQGETLCLVFKYHDVSLWDVWKRRCGIFEQVAARRYSVQIVAGIAHLHKHDVAHRDLSLGNLLVSLRDDVVEVADLGLSACASSFLLERTVSTWPHRAPEVILSWPPCAGVSAAQAHARGQVAKLPETNRALDMWSFGSIVASLFTGRLFFQAEGCDGNADDADLAPLLQMQINFIGTPLGKWAEITSLPQWERYAPALTFPRVPSMALTSSTTVPQPLPFSHDMLSLVDACLLWDPAMRVSAARAAEHKALIHSPTALMRTPQSPRHGASGESHDGATSISTVAAECEAEVAKTCTCSGNCCAYMCKGKKLKQAFYRPVGKLVEGAAPPTCGAPLTSDDSGTYCRICACDVAGCTRPKSGGADFCSGHQAKKGEYTSPTGICPLPKKWSTWELRTTAERATLLRDLEPCDVTEFYKFALPLLASLEGTMLRGHDLLHLWAVAYMKWPIAIDAWKSHFSSPGVTAGLSSSALAHATTKSYVDGCSKVANAIAGVDLPYMHEMICRKSMAHTMGAQMWLQHLHIIVKDDLSGDTSTHAAKRRCMHKKSAKLQEAEPLSAARLRIGQQGQQFSVCAHDDVWSQIVAISKETRPIKLPESAPDMLRFIADIKDWLQAFPPCMRQSGEDDVNAKRYTRRHIQRKIILAVSKHYDAMGPTERGVSASSSRFGSISKGDLQDCIADQGEYLRDLDDTMTWQGMESTFGMHPLMISCWCCLLSDVKKDAEKAVFNEGRKHSSLRAAACKLADTHGGILPTPGALARRRACA